MNGHAMRLLDDHRLACDGIGPGMRFAGHPVQPRDGILYPVIEPGASIDFPVPPLRIGNCTVPRSGHCGRYVFEFIVEADEGRPEERFERAVEAVAERGEQITMTRANGPPPRPNAYVVQTASDESAGAIGVVMGIIIPIVIAAALAGEGEE